MGGEETQKLQLVLHKSLKLYSLAQLFVYGMFYIRALSTSASETTAKIFSSNIFEKF